MKEFLFIIRGGDDVIAEETPSPEEMQAHMERWNSWMGGMAEAGKFVGGQPLMKEGKTLVESPSNVIDRPLAEGKELIGGYLIIKEENLEAATELAKGCPGFEYNCSVEVREINAM